MEKFRVFLVLRGTCSLSFHVRDCPYMTVTRLHSLRLLLVPHGRVKLCKTRLLNIVWLVRMLLVQSRDLLENQVLVRPGKKIVTGFEEIFEA